MINTLKVFLVILFLLNRIVLTVSLCNLFIDNSICKILLTIRLTLPVVREICPSERPEAQSSCAEGRRAGCLCRSVFSAFRPSWVLILASFS